jgi:hypothetical protein
MNPTLRQVAETLAATMVGVATAVSASLAFPGGLTSRQTLQVRWAAATRPVGQRR